jgi:hypothetical protein
MKFLGYLTLTEAESISGIKADTLKKRCQEGRISGAIKQGKTWFVPHGEIVKEPDLPQKDAILHNFALAADLGMEMPVTLFFQGSTISGIVIPMRKFTEATATMMKKGMTFTNDVDADTENLIRKSFDKMLYHQDDVKKDDEEIKVFNFLHLRDAALLMGNKFTPLEPAYIRVRLDSISGFMYGSITSDEAA